MTDPPRPETPEDPPLRELRWGWLGRVPYSRAAALQLELRERLRRGEVPEHLLLLEHPHVYTLGRNAEGADVVAPREWLSARGVEVVESDRGGKVTYHGPGQLVGYPILNLDPDRRDIRRYVLDLERALLELLAGCGVEAGLREGQEYIGVWVGERKIASLGIHLSRWLTTHGFALNVDPDLSFFGGIVPCGLQDVQATSVRREAGTAPSVAELAPRCAQILAERFGRRLVPLSGAEIAMLIEPEPA